MVPVIIIVIFQDVFLVWLVVQLVFNALKAKVGIQLQKLVKFMLHFLIVRLLIKQHVLLANQGLPLIL